MQSIYTAGTSNYSMANMYKPAGVVNISSSYNTPNTAWIDNKGQQQSWNGVTHSTVTVSSTSVIININSISSINQITNVLPSVQHIDYGQNPSAIQCLNGGNTPSTPRGTSISTGTHFTLN